MAAGGRGSASLALLCRREQPSGAAADGDRDWAGLELSVTGCCSIRGFRVLLNRMLQSVFASPGVTISSLRVFSSFSPSFFA